MRNLINEQWGDLLALFLLAFGALLISMSPEGLALQRLGFGIAGAGLAALRFKRNRSQ